MQNLDNLLSALAEFETNATREEKKAAIAPLRRLAKKLEIRSLELLEQRLLLMRAENTGDRETLQNLAEFGHQEISDWAKETLNPKPRTPGYPRLSL